jgi:hypothetical protein
MIKLTPPTIAASQSRAWSARQALWVAYTEDEQAVLIVKLGSCQRKKQAWIGRREGSAPRPFEVKSISDPITNDAGIDPRRCIIVAKIWISDRHLFCNNSMNLAIILACIQTDRVTHDSPT